MGEFTLGIQEIPVFDREEIGRRLRWWEEHEGIDGPTVRSDLRACLAELDRRQAEIDRLTGDDELVRLREQLAELIAKGLAAFEKDAQSQARHVEELAVKNAEIADLREEIKEWEVTWKNRS